MSFTCILLGMVYEEHAVVHGTCRVLWNGMLYITICDYLPYNAVSVNNGIESTS